MKKKKSIILFFLKMIAIFIVYDILNSILYPEISRVIIYGKYGQSFIVEMVCVFLIFIVLLLFKNGYIFTEKKESFLKSLMVGGPLVVYSIFLLNISAFAIISNKNSYDILSLVLYCASIGIMEEFLCRGWVQNEFIERFGNNRKQIILSIVFSSIIFGCMHISNIWIGGQSILDTVTQIIFAIGCGFLLGAIYFRTKNIWANAFIHGFWDFSLMAGEINIIKSCVDSPTLEYSIYSIITSIITAAIFIMIGLFVLRKSKTSNLIADENYTPEAIEKSEKKSSRYTFIALVLYFIVMFIDTPEIETTCYTYEDITVQYDEIKYPVYDEYVITEGENSYKISITENHNLSIENINTGDITYFDKNLVADFIIIKNENTYTILLNALNDYQTDTVIYYSNIESSIFDNTKESLNKISDSFTILESAPSIDKIGYITSSDNINYIFLLTSNNEYLLLKEDNLYLMDQ